MPDFGALRDLAFDLAQYAHGVDAVVTRPSPDDTPIATRILWVTPVSDGEPGGEFVRADPRRIAVVARDEVPSVPRGTRIVAPEKMGDATSLTWEVDGTERQEADQTRVFVRAVSDE
jgi:hypothetical protein